MVTADRSIVPSTPAGSAPDSCGAGETHDQVFLRGLAHDLRQMLTTISATAQVAERRMADPSIPPATTLTALGVIRDAARRMTMQLADLEDFALLEAIQPLPLVPRAVDLVALARETATRHAATSERHRFSVIVEDSDQAIVGQWDGRTLERALDNLVANALKFSPAGGDITITVGREMARALDALDAEVAVLHVRDEGVGIPADDLPHVFEWFRRAKNAASAIPGTGIGLAVVQQIIQQHGGTLDAASELGLGSTFTFRLPLSSGGADARPGA